MYPSPSYVPPGGLMQTDLGDTGGLIVIRLTGVISRMTPCQQSGCRSTPDENCVVAYPDHATISGLSMQEGALILRRRPRVGDRL